MSIKHKEKLLEYCQMKCKPLPQFYTEESGSLKTTTITLQLNENHVIVGDSCKTTMEAEQSAAIKAMTYINEHESTAIWQPRKEMVTFNPLPASSKESVKSVELANDNYKGQLLEYFQKRRTPKDKMPQFCFQENRKGLKTATVSISVDDENFEFIGDSSSKKNESEKSASKKALDFLHHRNSSDSIKFSMTTFRPDHDFSAVDSQQYSTSTTSNCNNDTSLYNCFCNNCGNILGPLSDFCFAKSTINLVHFAIKPAHLQDYKQKTADRNTLSFNVDTSKIRLRSTINCNFCQVHVGSEGEFFNDMIVAVFGWEKVHLISKKYRNCKWLELSRLPEPFDIVDQLTPAQGSELTQQENQISPRVDVSLDLPTRELLRIDDIFTHVVIPREYQLEVYYNMLLSNCLVVMPTGTGKTLPAAMILAKYKQMNPQQLVAFIVDRVPLVEQQASAITNFTELRLCKLMGNYNTSRNRKDIAKYRYDGVVATAGAFKELIDRRFVKLSAFSLIVFDECHHATGNHVYNKLLDEIRKIPELYQPRLVGLSATPCEGEREDDVNLALANMMKSFSNAKVIKPTIVHADNKMVWLLVHWSYKQLRFTERVYQVFENVILPQLQQYKDCPSEALRDVNKILADHQNLIGFFRSILSLYQSTAQEVQPLIEALEINDNFGPVYAERFLEGKEDLFQSDDIKISVDQLSPILIEMENVIVSQIMESVDDFRVLVFVETRTFAKNLCCRFRKSSCESIQSLHSEFIVGQNDDGMSIPQQQRVIRNFNNGTTKLLISTSVVEEGFDVSECKLVIRVGGKGNLIQFVQSRGRARAENSRMYIILNHEEEHKAKDIRSKEEILDRVISIHQAKSRTPFQELLDRRSEVNDSSIFDEAIDDVRMRMEANLESFSSLDEKMIHELTLLIKITQGHMSAEEKQHRVITALELTQICEVLGYVELPRSQLLLLTNMLTAPLDDSFTMISVQVCSGLQNYMKQLTFHWETLRIADTSNACLLYDDTATNDVGSSDDLIKYEERSFVVDEVCAGFLEDGKHFYSLGKLNCFNHLEIEPSSRIVLTGPISNQEYVKLDIPLVILSSFVFLSGNYQSKSFHLYFCLSSTPIMNFTSIEGTKRVSVLNSTTPPGDDCENDLYLLSRSKAISIKLHADLWPKLMASRFLQDNKILGVPSLVTKIIDYEHSYLRDDSSFETIKRLLKDVDDPLIIDGLWNLAVIRDIVVPRIFSVILDKFIAFIIDYKHNRTEDSKNNFIVIIDALKRLPMHIYNINVFSNSTVLQVFESLLSDPTTHSIEINLSGEYEMIRQMVVTPSKVICRQAIPVKTSRFLRQFSGSYQFVYVYFREETFRSLHNRDVFQSRYLSMLKDGISILNGCLTFYFVSSSASQMRQQTGIFLISSNGDAASSVELIRNALIPDYRDIFKTSYHKMMSRFGLFCTADVELMDTCTNGVGNWTHHRESDRKTSDEKLLLTDGAGSISEAAFQTLIQCYKRKEKELLPFFIDHRTTAIQIRYSGMKGVLTKDPCLDGETVLIRDSMVKFESNHMKFCVVKASGYNTLRLNRDMLNLLFSFTCEDVPGSDWDPYPYVSLLQDEEINKIIRLLFDNSHSYEYLASHGVSNQMINTLKEMKLILSEEPLWRRVLELIYDVKVKYLRTKTLIPVSKGALLIGIPDPYEVLEDNEIFVQICRSACDEDDMNELIIGNVLVFRNPCLDTADLRIVQAVDHPALKCFVNVVVFPAKDRKNLRSISAECSGGDLDGDQFGIIYDENLVPPTHRQFRRLNYDEILENGRKTSINEETRDPSEFVLNVMCNSNLGKISRLHLALSDQLPNSARDPLAREVAACQSIAVDYPKTGVAPKLPAEACKLVRRNGYPSFMENKSKASYESTKPLGMLYRTTVTACCRVGLKSFVPELDARFLCIGYEVYLSRAADIYKHYSQSLSLLMTKFGIKSEEEMILGINRDLLYESQLDLEIEPQPIQASWMKLRDIYRSKFFEEESPDEQCAWASAWYAVSYSVDDSNTSDHNRNSRYLTFPWIIFDVLAKLLKETDSFCAFNDDKIFLIIGSQVHRHWEEYAASQRDLLQVRMNMITLLRAFFMKKHGEYASNNFGVYPFGSVAQLLCDRFSDIDIYVGVSTLSTSPNDQMATVIKQGQHDVCSIEDLSNIVTDIAKLRKTVDSTVPLLRIVTSMSSLNDALVENNINVDLSADALADDEDVNVDITNRFDGVLKAAYMIHQYGKYSYLLPLFSYISNWARVCGLVRAKDGNTVPLLRTGELHALIFHLLSHKVQYDGSELNIDISMGLLADIYQRSKNCNTLLLGIALYEFFDRGSKMMTEEFNFEWPIPDRPSHRVKYNVIYEFKLCCMMTLNLIGHHRDVNAAMSHLSSQKTALTRFEFGLPSPLVKILRVEKSYHEFIISQQIGTVVRFEKRQSLFTIAGLGTASQIASLRRLLDMMIFSGRVSYCHIRKVKNHRYFLKGSTGIFVRSSKQRVKLVPYFWKHHPNHSLCSLQSLEPVDWNQSTNEAIDDSIWLNHFKAKVFDHWMHQFSHDGCDIEDNSFLRLTVTFGKFYMIHGFETFKTRYENILVKDIEEILFLKNHRTDLHRLKYDSTALPKRWDIKLDTSEPEAKKTDESRTSSQPDSSAKTSRETSSNPESEKKKRLSVGNYSEILSQSLPTTTLDINQLISALEEKLCRIGFSRLKGPMKNGVEDVNSLKSTWKVEVRKSQSYSSDVYVHEDNTLAYVFERPVMISSDILVDHRKPNENSVLLTNHDMRMKLSKWFAIPESDSLYTVYVPEGKSPIEFDSTNSPKPSSLFGDRGNEIVQLARHSDGRLYYYCCIDDKTGNEEDCVELQAVLTYGKYYRGIGLQTTTMFAEFEIRVDAKPLLSWLKNNLSKDRLWKWFCKMIDALMTVSNALK